MQRRLSSVLLCGAAIMAVAVPMAGPNLNAQSKYPLEVAFTYNATLSDLITSKDFWMQGGGVEVHGRFYGGIGVVADVAGMHAANIDSSGVDLNLVTATFGPRYTWSPTHRRYALFGQALVGEAFGFNSVFPSVTGANTTSYSLAVNSGGGLNIALSPHIALRAFEANWLRTQLPNSTNNAQNNVSLGTGIVFRFR
jgi:hypothetical protein